MIHIINRIKEKSLVSINSYFFIYFTIMAFLSGASGQESVTSLAQIITSFERLNYSETLELTSLALEKYQAYTPEELVTIYKYRAFASYYLGDEQLSELSFKSALSINPQLELDPVVVSPKIIKFFNQTAENFHVEPAYPETAEIRYIQIVDPRPAAAWRSLILPGWGQVYKGEKTKGYIVFSAFVLNAAGLITAVIKEQNARDDYLEQTNPQAIMSTYNSYDNWYQTRQILTYSLLLIWAYAIGDALWSLPPSDLAFPTRISANQDSFTLTFYF